MHDIALSEQPIALLVLDTAHYCNLSSDDTTNYIALFEIAIDDPQPDTDADGESAVRE